MTNWILRFIRAVSLFAAALLATPAFAAFNLSVVVDPPQSKPNGPGGVSFTGSILLAATDADQDLGLRGFDIARLDAVPLSGNIAADDVSFTYGNGSFSHSIHFVLETFVHGEIANQSVGSTPREIVRFTATITDQSKSARLPSRCATLTSRA